MSSEEASTGCSAVIAEDAASAQLAATLAETLGLPRAVVESALPAGAVVLSVAEGRLRLRRAGSAGRPFAPRWQPRRPARGRDPLLRAVGAAPRSVLDACAGFGEDSFALAAAGLHVVACERNPVVFLLLAQAHEEALADPALSTIAERIEVHQTDAASALESGAIPPPETIYLDPMFPPKRKRSALPRLEMQLLQALVEERPEDEARLLAVARLHARERTVWKRPMQAPDDPAATSSQRGKLVRYDIYRRPAARP